MRGSTRKRGKNWTAYWDTVDETSTRKQRTKGGFPTQKAAQRHLATVIVRVADGSYVEPSKLTLGEYLTTEWLPAVESTLRPLSRQRYANVIRLYVVPRIGGVRLQSLSPAHLNALYADLERDGLSVSTRRLVHAVVGRALRDAERWGRVPRNVARMADPPSHSGSRASAWTASELRRFLDHVADDRLFALWCLAATTGMRRGELLGVTWRALDLDAGRLSVEQQLVPTKGGVTFGAPKSSRSRRTVALDGETVDALRKTPRDAAARARLRRTGLQRR